MIPYKDNVKFHMIDIRDKTIYIDEYRNGSRACDVKCERESIINFIYVCKRIKKRIVVKNGIFSSAFRQSGTYDEIGTWIN